MEKEQPTSATFEPDDELEGFEKCSLDLPREDDGPLCATLVRQTRTESDDRPGVLYLHGFADYFFQVHLARAFEEAGFRFYALDLRRYGRSLRSGNRANWANSITEYFPEIDWALGHVQHRQRKVAAIVAHSTGALIAAHYLSQPRLSTVPGCLVMNSPFLRFNLGRLDRAKLKVVLPAAKFFPRVVLPERMSSIYGQTLHLSQQGEWDYDLNRKPLTGFPLYTGWFRMIQQAQDELPRVRLQLPVLCLHSDRSKMPGKDVEPDDFARDTVLDVEDIKSLAPLLGPDVSMLEVQGGVHDLVLSERQVRNRVLASMVQFVSKQWPPMKVSA